MRRREASLTVGQVHGCEDGDGASGTVGAEASRDAQRQDSSERRYS